MELFNIFKKKYSTNAKGTVSQSNVSHRNESTKENKYGISYNVVFNYNETMARWLTGVNEVPKHSMDWLAEAIQNGVQIEFPAVIYSVEKGLPFLCYTEDEAYRYDNEEDPLRDSIAGIYSVISMYKYGALADDKKQQYWINRALTLAASGNMMARALICWRFCHGDFISPELLEKLKGEYEDSLMKAIKAGDAYAQLAVAKYNQAISDEEREELYLLAIEKGLSDACYYYAKHLDQKRFVANGMTVNMPPYGTDEWQEYMRVELSLYKKGAELDNGILAGYCQYRLGDMYKDGDLGLLKDQKTAQYWYKMAYANGYEKAKMWINDSIE